MLWRQIHELHAFAYIILVYVLLWATFGGYTARRLAVGTIIGGEFTLVIFLIVWLAAGVALAYYCPYPPLALGSWLSPVVIGAANPFLFGFVLWLALALGFGTAAVLDGRPNNR